MNLHEELRDHRDAVDEFIALAKSVHRDDWYEERAEGKWSPAQIAEHVALTYETLLAEAEGRGGMRVVTKWWRRMILRIVYLPRILRDRAIPGRPPAPREVRPKGDVTLDDAIARIASNATQLQSRIVAAPRMRFTHAYFGKLRAAAGVRFVATHTRHHAAQLRECLEKR